MNELYSKQQEEADDRIMMHISHGSANGIKSVLVNSADTDAFINLIYHFKLSFDIDELYVTIGGTKRTRKTVPLHGCSLCLLIDLALFGPLLHSLYNRDWPTRGGLWRAHPMHLA